jgi:hypothetical protein
MGKKSGKPHPRENITLKQSRLVKALAAGAKTKAEAARIAGYSPKNASQSANQALGEIRKKAPQWMDELGLSVPVLIENHLRPLLNAKTTKFSQSEGKFTDSVDVEDNGTRTAATRMALELQDAFPARNAEITANAQVEVVILDVPRPDRSEYSKPAIKVDKVIEATPAKPDPRPKD